MAKRGFLARHGIVRNAIKEDLRYFALPAMLILVVALYFTAWHGQLRGFWATIWALVSHPSNVNLLPTHALVGIGLFVAGLSTMLVGQITLWRFYSGTLVIKEGHRLITHGIYRFVRHPIYLGAITACIGLPVYTGSLYGLLIMVGLIPVVLVRIRIEERLLTEEFGDAYRTYRETTSKLIPFVY